MPERTAVPARYALCDRLLALARRCALRAGLPPDDADDCASAFVIRVLSDDSETCLRPSGEGPPTGTLSARWAVRVALNHAIDFRRRLERIAAHEEAGDPPDEVAPDTPLLRQVASDALRDGLAALDPVPRELMVRHYVEGRSVPEIAAGGRSVQAAEQALVRARRRLRGFLERKGWTEQELRLYLAAPPDADF